MADILIIDDKPIFDNSIVKIETHTYNPYANTTFGYSDEIRIPIQQQDLYTLPSFMFDEIRYELNGVEIDRNRNVGITSTLKNYISLTSDNAVMLQNAGWSETSTTSEGFFNFCVPFRNSKLEPEIELHKIQWRMSHVILNEVNKLSMLRTLDSGRYLSMTFCSWDLYEYPLLQSTTKHSWAVKAATQLEKPRYVIFALQTDRKNVMSKNSTIFDDCKLTNVKLFLNSEYYPYDDLNLDFDKKRYAIFYDMYIRFRKAYYGNSSYEAFCNVAAFLSYGPFVVIDCS
ncbi:uncharacterized protein [Cardiocondyla obscurior]|uniref:uncharacterized protein n=1 Tax=Cardiocondyla obscurior TaxID=286306 RepID=UPI003965628C